jgi:Tol biopolymer transport system component
MGNGPPPAVGQIAFESSQGIEVMNTDGSGRRVLIGGAVAQPAWSPDGARLAFSRTSDGWQTSALYTARADGSDERKITDGTHGDATPAWSPDGSRMAFTRNAQLVVMNADGSGLTELPWGGLRPAWSPDGTKLVFGLLVDSRCAPFGQPCKLPWLAIGNADGTGSASIVAGRLTRDPAWSPSASELAFQRGADIWLADADGSAARALTATVPPQEDRDPAWSPDGAEIGFARDGDLYVIDRDGSGLRRLTATADLEGHPGWRPVPPAASRIQSRDAP